MEGQIDLTRSERRSKYIDSDRAFAFVLKGYHIMALDA